MKVLLTAERLREVLAYDETTGVFRRLVAAQKHKAGSVTGTVHISGYVHITIDRRTYKAHRLAWLYKYGCWPKGDIDHIDGTRSNNCIPNLRDVSTAVNLQNQREARRGKKGGLPLGVEANHSRWKASITAQGRKVYLGTFDTPSLAHEAYITAKRQLHEGCTL